MTQVTIQKNVIVQTADQMFSLTHKQFANWLATSGVTEFLFRPCTSRGDSLEARRIKSIQKSGFNVVESGDSHHYMKAVAV